MEYRQTEAVWMKAAAVCRYFLCLKDWKLRRCDNESLPLKMNLSYHCSGHFHSKGYSQLLSKRKKRWYDFIRTWFDTLCQPSDGCRKKKNENFV